MRICEAWRMLVRIACVYILTFGLFAACGWCTVSAEPPEVVWRFDRPGEVVTIKRTPDGGRIVAATEAGSIEVWDVATSRLVREIRVGLHSSISGMDVSPDGHSVLVSTSYPYGIPGYPQLKLWSLDDGSLSRDFHPNLESPLDAAFSPDGLLCVVAAGAEQDCCDGEGATVYNVLTGAIVRRWPFLWGDHAAFGRDGMTLALEDGFGVGIYRISDGALLHRFDQELGGVFSPDGSLLATMRGSSTIVLWRLSDFAELRVLPTDADLLQSVVFSRDGSLIACGATTFGQSPAATARVWRVQDGELLYAFGPPASSVSVDFMPDGLELLTGTREGALRRWSLTDGSLSWSLMGPPSYDALAALYSPDGTTIAFAELIGSRVWLLSAADGHVIRELSSDRDQYTCMAWSPDSSLLAAGTPGEEAVDPVVVVWDAGTGNVLRTLHGHSGQVTSLAFSPDGSRLASGSAPRYDLPSDSSVRIWNTANGELERVLVRSPAGVAPVFSLAYSPTGELLATGHSDEIVLVRRISDASVVLSLGEPYGGGRVNTVAFSSDGRMITAGTESVPAQVWDAASGDLLFRFRLFPVFLGATAFSPDNRALVCAVRYPIEEIRWYRTSDFSLFAELDLGVWFPGAFSFAPHGNSYAHGRQGGVGVFRSLLAPCRADWNVDGVLDSQDFYRFVDDFLNCDSDIDCSRDFNRDGVVNTQDFFDFVGAFFAGCG